MKAFDNSEMKQYQDEVKEKWGNTPAYREYVRRTKELSGQKQRDAAEGMDRIMAEFALCMNRGEAPQSAEAQKLVTTLREHITGNYYHCTREILMGLGQMYVEDARFRSNIDRHAEGTAAFIREAILVSCQK